MKTKENKIREELCLEYDFASMKGGVKGKYASRDKEGSNLVLLSPDVAEVFHDNKSVNEALRALIGIARAKIKHP